MKTPKIGLYDITHPRAKEAIECICIYTKNGQPHGRGMEIIRYALNALVFDAEGGRFGDKKNKNGTLSEGKDQANHSPWHHPHTDEILEIWKNMNPAGYSMVNDHAVPVNIIIKKCVETHGDPEKISKILQKYLHIAIISKKEDAILNKEKLGKNMPKDWDGIDPWARYKEVGIKLNDPIKFV